MPRGYGHALYLMPFDRRTSIHAKMFGWKGTLTEGQTVEIARRYHEFVDIFEPARLETAPAPSLAAE
jgi:hypothetical protein